jgi:hypothetical protein
MATANVIQTSVSGGTSNALALQGDGVFLPKLNTASRTGLTLTASDSGLMVYDTTLGNQFIWTGSGWESIPSSGDTSNTQVVFNDNGVLTGNSNLTFDPSTSKLTVGSDVLAGSVTLGKGGSSVSSNTAIGVSALISASATASSNTAVGASSQMFNFTGVGNTSLGRQTLSSLSFSGSDNVAVGYLAGSTVSSGSSNILLGRSAATETAASSNQICIGSTSYWVGTNGGPTVWWAGASGAIGYWRVVINGTAVKIPVYAD